MSTNNITFKELDIVHICKPALKHSYISIKKDSQIVLKTPKVSDMYIYDLLLKKEGWIRKQLSRVADNPLISANLQDEVLLFGEIISIDGESAIELRKYLQKADVYDMDAVSRCYDRFYKKTAKEHVVPVVQHYSMTMGLEYREIKFKKMKSRWGSCRADGTVTFNTQLAKVDKRLIEYVVVHELSHLRHMNHSKSFYSLVSQYIPDWRDLDRKLRYLRLA